MAASTKPERDLDTGRLTVARFASIQGWRHRHGMNFRAVKFSRRSGWRLRPGARSVTKVKPTMDNRRT
jgi:hypothetical protein